MTAKRPRTPKRSSDTELVQDVAAFIRRYVVITDSQLMVLAVYTLHTHLVEYCFQTPYISISSPERECGKSRLMEVLELLVARPWMVVNPSEAVLFRKVHDSAPTLLWDEIDTVFSPKSAQYHEGHRAMLDQGHRMHGKVPRFINKVVEFNVFCPKVFAGIGALPDTIASRSIPIRLERKATSERVDDFILQDVQVIAEELRERVEKWAAEYGEQVGKARPENVPDELSDRMKEGCFSLMVIADRLTVGKEIRAALVDVLGRERIDSQETMRIRLLRDVRRIFADQHKQRGKVAPAVKTETLLHRLMQFDESPWPDYYGRGFTAKDLADLLRPYNIHPRPIRFKDNNGQWKTTRGYRRDAFENDGGLADAWERYLGGDERSMEEGK